MQAAPDITIPPVLLAHRGDAEEAHALIADFGAAAQAEATRRAARSRNVGNVVHFIRWRRIGRLVELLTGREADATRH